MSEPFLLSPATLAELATGRARGLFQADYDGRAIAIADALAGARVLVIGGAGSIGGAVVRLLAGLGLAALHVVDSNENSLVELTRDLRASGAIRAGVDIRWLPLDFGDGVMRRFLDESEPYDHVLNFAAVKHVRSEKDVYSVLRMLDVNVVRQRELLGWLAERDGATTYFSVSTDKAANPVNLMGASKRLMEHVMFAARPGGVAAVRSARFANVAFSNGSLLQGWLHRLARRQPLAVPRETRRFFVSLEESGQICMLAAFRQADRRILIPRVSAEMGLRRLEDIAAAFLERLGYEASLYDDAAEAMAGVTADTARGRYPLLLTPLDTTGEKPFEEFVGRGERGLEAGFTALQSITYEPAVTTGEIDALVDGFRRLLAEPRRRVAKDEIVRMVGRLLPELRHQEAGRSLDERI